MNLEEFVGKRNINISQLARTIGYSRSHLQGVLNGRYKPGKKLANALQIASEGKINAADLLSYYKKEINKNLTHLDASK